MEESTLVKKVYAGLLSLHFDEISMIIVHRWFLVSMWKLQYCQVFERKLLRARSIPILERQRFITKRACCSQKTAAKGVSCHVYTIQEIDS